MAGRPIIRTCAAEDPGLGAPIFTVYLAGGAWVTFGAVRHPEPGIWVLRGDRAERVSFHDGWDRPTADDLALLDATPAGRAWRAKFEGGGS